MMDELYTLEWRGRQTPPMPLDTIKEALEAGDIHSMYQINDRGRWRLLRDFLEDHRLVKAPPPAYEPPASPAQRQEEELNTAVVGGSAASGAVPMGACASADTPKNDAARFPTWLMATLIGLIVVILCVGVMGAYMLFRPSAPPVASAAPVSAPKEAAAESSAATSGRLQADLSVQELVKRKQRFVVQINSSWEESTASGFMRQNSRTGNGVHIRNEGGFAIFVTHQEVLETPKNASKVSYAVLFHGEARPAEIVAVSKSAGLARLRVEHAEGAEGGVLQMSEMRGLKMGEECVSLGGHPGSGFIARFDEYKDNRVILTSGNVNPGAGGGGLFRRSDGSLIGVTLNSSDKVQSLNVVIPAEFIVNDQKWEPYRP